MHTLNPSALLTPIFVSFVILCTSFQNALAATDQPPEDAICSVLSTSSSEVDGLDLRLALQYPTAIEDLLRFGKSAKNDGTGRVFRCNISENKQVFETLMQNPKLLDLMEKLPWLAKNLSWRDGSEQFSSQLPKGEKFRPRGEYSWAVPRKENPGHNDYDKWYLIIEVSKNNRNKIDLSVGLPETIGRTFFRTLAENVNDMPNGKIHQTIPSNGNSDFRFEGLSYGVRTTNLLRILISNTFRPTP